MACRVAINKYGKIDMTAIDIATARLKILISEMKNHFSKDKYDLILVGDGSGTTHGKPCGWFVSSYDCLEDRVVFHSGSRSDGTSNIAELLPYIQALESYHARNTARKASTRVLIISDSELTVGHGSRQYSRNTNLALWSSMDWFESNGYSLTWRHTPRNKFLPTTLADLMARSLRQSIEVVHSSVSQRLIEVEE